MPATPPCRCRQPPARLHPTHLQEVACYLGLELGKIKIKRFADGEIYVQVGAQTSTVMIGVSIFDAASPAVQHSLRRDKLPSSRWARRPRH